MADFFSQSGRYARKKYWLGALGLLALMIVMLMALGPLMSSKGSPGGGPLVSITLLSIPFIGLYAKLIIHRLHDLGWSGWWFLLLGPLLIPLPIWMWMEAHTQHAVNNKTDFLLEFGAYGIFLGGFILLGCIRGTVGQNEYGPDPVD
jgi:uncharacterized membrane protein YhaH (DUF805 family)